MARFGLSYRNAARPKQPYGEYEKRTGAKEGGSAAPAPAAGAGDLKSKMSSESFSAPEKPEGLKSKMSRGNFKAPASAGEKPNGYGDFSANAQAEANPRRGLLSQLDELLGASASGGNEASVQSAAPDTSAQGSDHGAAENGGASGSNGGGYDIDRGISDLYNGLYSKLRAYGVTGIPKFSALYAMFESFLRPSIEAAIRARRRSGKANMAELDADAYARGMGASTYLSSIKAREQDAVESDVTGLEGRYSASMAEYLYKAVSSMQSLESDMAKTRMQLAAQAKARAEDRRFEREKLEAARIENARLQRERLKAERENLMLSNNTKLRLQSMKNNVKASVSDDTAGNEKRYGHNKNGAYFDGEWYDGDFSYMEKKQYGYREYAKYLQKLSESERYLFFTSSDRYWRMRRWQVQYNLTEVDYGDLYSAYMPTGRSGGNGAGRPGSEKWITSY
ncbi:MAG: hypothetical protein K6G56_05925 [Clostridiales bacterium]|nr:hypothetical protein [Clostridiales bacterium]